MFKVGDEVVLSEAGVAAYSKSEWAGYSVPLAIYLRGGVVTHTVTCENGKNQVYAKALNDGPSVWFEEEDLILASDNDEEKCIEYTKAPNPLDKQVSGNHYKGCKIQPIEYIHANSLDYFQGNVVKYVTRHKDKNGKADIEKAIHYLELILELQYKDE